MDRVLHLAPLLAAVPHDRPAITLYLPDGNRLMLTARAARRSLANLQDALQLLDASGADGGPVTALGARRARVLAPLVQKVRLGLRVDPDARASLWLITLLLFPLAFSLPSALLVALLVAGAKQSVVFATLVALPGSLALSFLAAWRLLGARRNPDRRGTGHGLRPV